MEAAGLVGSFEWDIARDRLVADARFCALHGMAPEAGLAGLPLAAMLAAAHPADRAAIEAARAPPHDPGAPFAAEYRITLPGAPERRVLAQGAITRDEAGALLLSGVVVDVTARHLAEATLRESEARFRAMVDLVPNIVWFAAADGQPLYLNRRWQDFSGQRPAQALAGGWQAALHPEDAPASDAALARAASSGAPYETELRYRRHDGAWRWFLARAEPVRDEAGRITAWFGSSTDIHAQKSAEAALAESEARLQLAQEAAGIGVFERDFALEAERWTPQMFRVWGLDPAARAPFIAEEEYIALMLPEDAAAHRARVAKLRADAAVSRYASEYRIRRPDTGEIRWLLSRGEYVRDAAGRPLLARGTAHDITDRKAAEAQETLLRREVDHRARNALAVVQAALRLTRRDDPEDFARAVEGRVAALARVLTMLAERGWTGADLRGLLRAELAAFDAGRRLALEGPEVQLPAATAQPLALALHELASNAVKHGALSVPEGRLAIEWSVQQGAAPLLSLRWREAGGPPVAGPPQRQGFGARMMQATLGGQLRGSIALDWRQEGLACEIRVPLARVSSAPSAP